MSKPIKHGDKWRIRWKDETGRRVSAVFTSFAAAEKALIVKKAHVFTAIASPNKTAVLERKTCEELFTYYQSTYNSGLCLSSTQNYELTV